MQWALDCLLGWVPAVALAAGATAWAGSAAAPRLPGWTDGRLWWVPTAIAVLGVTAVVVVPVWRYRVHRWEITADVVYTRTGWFAREWLLVPVSRIQTVDTRQGPTERALRLATVTINTASHAGSSRLTGLPADLATGLARDLAHRAHELRDDAT